MPAQAELLDMIVAAVREQLEAARTAVLRELRAYPRPVAGCDQQYNHLLAARDGIVRDLQWLTDIARSHQPPAERRKEVDAFIRTSTWFDDAERQRLAAIGKG